MSMGKYNSSERKIATKISRMISENKLRFKKYHEVEVQIHFLKEQLHGKYGKQRGKTNDRRKKERV